MTTTSSATILTDSNGASSSSSGDILSISTNDALIIESDPNGIITLAEHHNEIISNIPPSPNDTKSTNIDVINNDNKLRSNKQPLSSTTSSSRDDVKEVDPRDRRLVYISSLQLILGGVILIWSCAVISHEASLAGASAAAALIGGVAGLAAGVAGFTSRRSKRRNKSAHTSATSTVALSAIALAACSLVMALSATGLLRDGSRPTQQITWGALLSNTGLLLTSGLLSATCVVAGALWRRDAGICTSSRRHTSTRPPASPEPLPGTPPAPHKHKLVSKWLGQQQGGGPALFMISPMPPPSGRGGSVYSGHSAPHIIPLHMPPPPPPLAMPPYLLPPMGPPPHCMLHGNAMTLPSNHRQRRRSRHQRRNSCVSEGRVSQPPALIPVEIEIDPEEEARLQAAAAKRQRQPNALTEEEVERSYTGLDRAIAEDFITNTMDKHREPSRRISTISRTSRPEDSSHF